jgi:hypothetical protein
MSWLTRATVKSISAAMAVDPLNPNPRICPNPFVKEQAKSSAQFVGCFVSLVCDFTPSANARQIGS